MTENEGGNDVSSLNTMMEYELNQLGRVQWFHVEDRILWLFGFQNVRSYRTWLQLMCCAGLVVRPCISEYPEIQDGQIWL